MNMVGKSRHGKRVEIKDRPSTRPLSGKTGTVVKRDVKPILNWDIWVELDEPVHGSTLFAFNRWELQEHTPSPRPSPERTESKPPARPVGERSGANAPPDGRGYPRTPS
jgi:hypothetical protein